MTLDEQRREPYHFAACSGSGLLRAWRAKIAGLVWRLRISRHDGVSQHLGMPAPVAFLIICAQFLGGLGLIVGLLTRIAALGIGVEMIGAIFMVHLPNGFFMNWMRQPERRGDRISSAGDRHCGGTIVAGSGDVVGGSDAVEVNAELSAHVIRGCVSDQPFGPLRRARARAPYRLPSPSIPPAIRWCRSFANRQVLL